jgi:hypothetical protein
VLATVLQKRFILGLEGEAPDTVDIEGIEGPDSRRA